MQIQLPSFCASVRCESAHPMSPAPQSRRAILSVSDKSGIVEFARALAEIGFELVSTGGTAKALTEAKIPVTAVEEVTGYPECFGGRVKTMHPAIMGGVLLRRENKDDLAKAKELNISPIDLVVVNLYPFEKTVADPKTSREQRIEQIDIGGPTLLRSAAKNAAHVTVVCDTADYNRVITQLRRNGDTTPELRSELAAKVFALTAQYDAVIAAELSDKTTMGVVLTNGQQLRYGENPHQSGAYYDLAGKKRAWAVVQEEKPISYLNLFDADAAWNLVHEFSEPAAACIKHGNPSGVAIDEDITVAFQKSYDADKLSAFGVVVALNRPCTGAIIQKIIDQKIFTEVIIAPSYEADALNLIKEKPKIRALTCSYDSAETPVMVRSSLGGMLVQSPDTRVLNEKDLTIVTSKKPTSDQVRDLLFAWTVVKHAKSNAIVFAKNGVTTGIGCGQTSRVDSTHIAVRRAGERAKGSVMASDAFFPFPDSLDEAAKNGISAIIQPGGSVKDAEVIAAAEQYGIPMVTTGVRGFKH